MGLRAVVLMLAAGCVTARWEQFDGSFDPKQAAKDPVIFDGAGLPPEYRIVGVIEVLHANTTAPQTIVDKARREGRDLGCELIARERLAPREGDDVEVEVIIGGPPGGLAGQSDEANRARFVCAVRQ